MTLFLSVAVVSAAGWIASLILFRSAARRHLVLSAALLACLLLPLALAVRSGTSWTLLALRTQSNTRGLAARQTAPSSSERLDELPPRESIASDARVSGPASSSPSLSEPTITSSENSVARQSDVPSSPFDAWLAATRAIAIVYAFVTCVLLLQLLFGLVAVHRIRRRAVEIETFGGDIRVFEADVACPMAVGFGRPIIILPQQFRTTIGAEGLRDVLVHEAEHLRRGDHWMLLLQRLAAALYWPIVTVHLLNRSLDRAREELCDNAVLAGRTPADYGETLLQVARLVGHRHPPALSLAATVIRHGELERRVVSLLDPHRDRRRHVGRPARWSLAATLAVLAILVGTTRVIVVADELPPVKPPAEHTAAEKLPAPNAAITWTGIPKVDPDNPILHRGVVLGPEGKPVGGAAIYAASTIELLERLRIDTLGPVRAITDDQGRFEFDAPDLSWVTAAGERKRWETLLVATKAGLAPGWLKTWGADRTFRSHWDPWLSRDVAIRLRPPATLTGRFLMQDGKPVAEGRVRLTGLMAPIEYDLNKHIPQEERKSLGLFSSIDYAEELYRPSVLPGLKTEATTNAEGRFELPGLPEGYIAQIEIAQPQVETTSLRVAVRQIEPVYREPAFGEGHPTLTLYGSGFTAELAEGATLRGQVVVNSGFESRAAPGVIVAQANHNTSEGLSGQRFRTDGEGRFEVTGLPNRPEGYELAFVGSFAAPAGNRRQRIVPGENARVELPPAAAYRLKLTDANGNPLDREVFSVPVQQTPDVMQRGAKVWFNDAERVAPGVYQGIVPLGPGAVLVRRGAKSDRPVAVDPKAFFAPGRTDWTREEALYAYGDAWRIAYPAVITTDALAASTNPTISQLDLAAVVFTKARAGDGLLELSATVESDPPVEVRLVDDAGQPVTGASVARQLQRYDAGDLPATVAVYGLHPQRAEFLVFQHAERGLIGTLSTTWTDKPVRVVLQPAARLTGRFTNAAGQIDQDFAARIVGERIKPGTYIAGRVFQTTDKVGERPGEFLLLVPPGAEISGEFVRKTANWETRPSAGKAFGPLTPKPGETIDLGNLVVP